MPVFETFSRRQAKRAKAGKADVYQYDSLPQQFRIQVAHIWKTAIGPYFHQDPWQSEPLSNRAWRWIHDTLARERGVVSLLDGDWHEMQKCVQFLLTADANAALDIVEITFRYIDHVVRRWGYDDRQICQVTQDADDAIEELNYRFRQHAIGYEYMGGELIRVDSQYVHPEVVRPAFSLLEEEHFRGASDEFLRAHEHYRKGRYKEAIVEALKAFESTMKSICQARKWSCPANATAKPLIEIMFAKGLVPSYLQSHFGGLRAAMESGVPTVRDKTSGHGQGPQAIDIPPYLAAYVLHLAASNIVLLVEAHRSMK
jgi:hypothetical protein